MKKIKLILLLFISAASVNAQFYVSGFSGYSFATSPVVIKNMVVIDTVLNANKAKFSYGKGMNLGFGLGYTLNENISVELDCYTQILARSKYNSDWSSYLDQSTYSYKLLGINGEYLLKNRSIQMAPMFIYAVKTGRVNPFIKAGVNFLFSQSITEHNYTSIFDNEAYEYGYKTTGGLSIGFRGAAGVSFCLNQNVALYSEFMAVSSMYNYKKSEVITYKVNGEDQISTIEDKIFEAEDDEGLVNYSHIGLNFGIKYFFNK